VGRYLSLVQPILAGGKQPLEAPQATSTRKSCWPVNLCISPFQATHIPIPALEKLFQTKMHRLLALVGLSDAVSLHESPLRQIAKLGQAVQANGQILVAVGHAQAALGDEPG